MNPMSDPQILAYLGQHPEHVDSLSPLMKTVYKILQAEASAQSPKAARPQQGNHPQGPAANARTSPGANPLPRNAVAAPVAHAHVKKAKVIPCDAA